MPPTNKPPRHIYNKVPRKEKCFLVIQVYIVIEIVIPAIIRAAIATVLGLYPKVKLPLKIYFSNFLHNNA